MLKKKKDYGIEEIKKIDSVIFYRQIYNKACKSFWSIRPIFLISAAIGFIMIGSGFGLMIDFFFLKQDKTIKWTSFFRLFLFGILFLIPVFLVIFRAMRGRTEKYLKFLKETKLERGLDHKAINQLLEDISNLKIKYKNERDSLFKILLSICKVAIFPVTAAIFTGALNDLQVAALVLIFVCSFLLPLVLSAWLDYSIIETFKNLGIKNYYMVSVVERELKFMKKIKDI